MITPLLLSSKLKCEYLDNGFLYNFNEIHLYYKNDLKCVDQLYIININIIKFFEDHKLSQITTKLYFMGEIVYENEFHDKKKLIIGVFSYFQRKYIYCIIQKNNLSWINNIIPEYKIYIGITLESLLYKCLTIKEIKSLDSWFRARITGYTTDDYTESFSIYDDFLDHYHVNFKLVQKLYNEYHHKTREYNKLNNEKYIETFYEILDRNNLYIPNKRHSSNTSKNLDKNNTQSNDLVNNNSIKKPTNNYNAIMNNKSLYFPKQPSINYNSIINDRTLNNQPKYYPPIIPIEYVYIIPFK